MATSPTRAQKRHALSTRLWHWLNLWALVVLFMSGLNISNAHPRLYWGDWGFAPEQAWLHVPRFPGWMTIPSSYSLSAGRRWHLAFAWIFAVGLFAYWLASLLNRHARRDLAPRRAELAPRHIWADIKAHARLRFPRGEAALRYNILQKLSYLGVVALLLPAMILSGLAMSPGMDASWPWLVDLFGGRQSARSIHFIAAMLLVLFVLVHLAMIVLAGPVNEIRSMITGWFRLPPERGEEPA